MRVRRATPGEVPAVMTVLDAGYLAVDAATLRDRIGDGAPGTVLVAVESARVLGALVLVDREVTAVAVRPGRRGQGIGTALIEAAADHADGPLRASFDASVRPFYESTGFDVEPADGPDTDRYRGVRG